MTALATDIQAIAWPTRPLRYLAEINGEVLSEDHPEDAEISYLDIGAVGHGTLTAAPEVMRFGQAPSRARRIQNS